MYFNILKKDLKRKRVMTIIILLFTILASCFVASGISNSVTVINGTDYFEEQSDVGDYMIVAISDGEDIKEAISKLDTVSGYTVEHFIQSQICNIKGGSKQSDNTNLMAVEPIVKDGCKYFDKDNKRLTEVKKGEAYLPIKTIKECGLTVGEDFTFEHKGIKKTFKLAGADKNFLFGSTMMGDSQMLISQEDYDEMVSQLKGDVGDICSLVLVDCSDTDAVNQALAEVRTIVVQYPTETLKLTYVMDMLMALVILALSVVLILVSFVVLKYVITFSINEEYREIGVMKAIGIKNRKIRGIFVLKYAIIAAIGSMIGFFLSVPFATVLLKSVSESMVLGNDEGILLNIMGAVIVALVMVGLAYFSTRKVKKCTPLDAIRDGQTGERYGKKSKKKLSKSHMKNPLFMAVNDILSSKKRYITIIIAFFICSIFTFGLVLMKDIMRSDKLIDSFGTKADIYMMPNDLYELFGIGDDFYDKTVAEAEDILKENGMPGKVSALTQAVVPVEVDGKKYTQNILQNQYIDINDFVFIKGTAPESPDEIAITEKVHEHLKIDIGDQMTINYENGEKVVTVTAYFVSMNNVGDSVLLHPDQKLSYMERISSNGFQVVFDDHPDHKTVLDRVEKLKKIFNTKRVYDAEGFVVETMKTADAMDAVCYLLLGITIIVVIMVTILMERSFVADEHGSIALLRAIGFSKTTIVRWHVWRFMIVAVIAEILAIALTLPVTHLWGDGIWRTMGQSEIHYVFNPLTILVIYPGAILIATFAAASLTALYTTKIKAHDIVNVE